MDFPRPPSVPGLIRRPAERSPPLSRLKSPDPPPSSNLQLRTSDGVVVVGFVSRRPDDSSQLINRVLDSNVFGSGNLDRILSVDTDEVRDWFRFRRISYYHEEDKGFLFLQFCPTRCPAFDGVSDPGSDFDSVLEQQEFGDLQGLLFMFSVCHVIIYIQEGSRFDTQILKKFRVLQASKQALAPYVRSQSASPFPSSRPHSSSTARVSPQPNSSTSARGGGIISRSALMSGLGSYTSLFPGQCNPVTLFAFLDDFSSISSDSCSVEETTGNSSVNNQPLNSGKFARSTLKGSGSVVVLSRPGSKSEGGLRKKLQSSLEAQIRFLIKKCKTLSSSDNSHASSRSGTVSNSAPLFSLDASKTVVLLDQSSNKKGEALEFASSLVDDVLDGKVKSDSLLLEKNDQIPAKEDVLSVKEFIYRCSDILRGKGGLATNSSNAGIGMVAVAAAAAAAAYAASGKTFNAPQLPHLNEWLSCSHQILDGILTAKGLPIHEFDISKKKHRGRNASPSKDETVTSKATDSLDVAVSWLGSGKGLNKKFSYLWCERALPVAMDAYLRDLPACYPTSVHEAHLQKALHSFKSMVRGPSVQLFTKKLEDECTILWKSGRQLCDAISLTGKPCVHQRHNVGADELLPGADIKPHSSGYVFLHACACGRSWRLRSDPFDFESANISFNCFPDCDKFLPIVRPPEVSDVGPILSSSWSLVRVGGSRYYEPSKGLLQSGFSATQKFLLKWVLFLKKQQNPNGLLPGNIIEDSMIKKNVVMPRAVTSRSKVDTAQLNLGAVNHGGSIDNGSVGDSKIKFGRGFPAFNMKKPFSEVVAGSASKDLLFPPLQQSRQPSRALEKDVKQKRLNDQRDEHVQDASNQESQESDNISHDQEILYRTGGIGAARRDPVLQIESNAVPVNAEVGEKGRANLMPEHVTAYIGFEHECPHGHRFLLSAEHLTKLGPSYSVPAEHPGPNSAETLKLKDGTSKLEKNTGFGKGRRKSSRMPSGINRMKTTDRPRPMVAKDKLYVDNFVAGKEGRMMSGDTDNVVQVIQDPGAYTQANSDDSGLALSMLSRNLPIFMNCPHCLKAFPEKDSTNTKYAGTISQLQRIFVVTPQFPVVLAMCPVVKFQESCLPPSVTDREQKLRFSFGCPVILPPDSFLSLRLPFVYGVQLEDGTQLPLNPSEQEPENTAWIIEGTVLQVLSKEGSLGVKLQT